MGKFNLYKRAIAFGTAGIMMATGGFTLSKKLQERWDARFVDEGPDNSFMIIHGGDYDTVGACDFDHVVVKASKKDIPVGVIIDSNAQNESDIFNDVEYAKGVIKSHKIDMPIYLNVDYIMTNDSLNSDMKARLVEDFLTKCSNNGIYVGIYGTDTNLCRLQKICDISAYDAYLVKESKDVKYKGTHHVYKKENGDLVKVGIDFEKAICDKDLNDSDEFVCDSQYVLKEGEDIIDIALKYGISVNDLLEFNGLKREDLTAGTTLNIPCIQDGRTVSTDDIFVDGGDYYIRGCDISYAQGTSPSWKELKDNFSFVIIKCSQGEREDNYFESNCMGCQSVNMPIGVYAYNDYWCSSSDEEALKEFKKLQRKQAKKALSLVKGKNVQYPVYLDIETADVGGSLSDEAANAMLDIWYETISEAGYIPGLYVNKSGFNGLLEHVSDDKLSKFDFWIAGGDQYVGSDKTVQFSLSEINPSTSIFNNPKYRATVAQSTDTCVGAGAGNHLGNLDIDFSNKDYVSGQTINEIMAANDEKTNSNGVKEFRRFDGKRVVRDVLVGVGVSGSIMTAGAIAGMFVISNKANQAKKRVVNRHTSAGAPPRPRNLNTPYSYDTRGQVKRNVRTNTNQRGRR